jgi:hypothetical protein
MTKKTLTFCIKYSSSFAVARNFSIFSLLKVLDFLARYPSLCRFKNAIKFVYLLKSRFLLIEIMVLNMEYTLHNVEGFTIFDFSRKYANITFSLMQYRYFLFRPPFFETAVCCLVSDAGFLGD